MEDESLLCPGVQIMLHQRRRLMHALLLLLPVLASLPRGHLMLLRLLALLPRGHLLLALMLADLLRGVWGRCVQSGACNLGWHEC